MSTKKKLDAKELGLVKQVMETEDIGGYLKGYRHRVLKRLGPDARPAIQGDIILANGIPQYVFKQDSVGNLWCLRKADYAGYGPVSIGNCSHLDGAPISRVIARVQDAIHPSQLRTDFAEAEDGDYLMYYEGGRPSNVSGRYLRLYGPTNQAVVGFIAVPTLLKED